MPKEHAEWRNSNGQQYLEVEGEDPFKIGVCQGGCLAEQIKHFKRFIAEFSVRYARKRQTYKNLCDLAQIGYEKFFPPPFIEEMKGLAEGVGEVEYKDILLQNCFFDIAYGQLIPDNAKNPLLNKRALGCTAFGIINKHSKDQNPITIIGQNFDYAKIARRALSFLHLKKLNKPEVFALRLGGMLCLPAGRNSLGVAMTTNAVKSRLQGNLSMPFAAKSRLCFETCNTAEACYELLFSIPSSGSTNYLIADNAEIIAVEVLPEHHIKTKIITTVARSNTFVTDQLQQYLRNPQYSKQRQYYAAGRLSQMYENKGGIVTDDDLLELLQDKPIICRKQRLQPKTIAFITRKYFGAGNPVDNPIGLIPF